MKTIFIVNPCAGRGNKVQELIDKINSIHSTDKEIYLTKAVGDATRYIKEYISGHGPARFIACGGGIKSNPLASICDGNININIVKNVSRLKFLRLLPLYMKGTFMKVKNIHRIILSTNCRRIVITPLDGKMRLCIDGEIIDAGKTCFEICPGVFNFVVPAKNEAAVIV